MTERNRAKKRIGDYFLEGELGRGECGVVYLAASAQTGARFAIKCLSKQRMNSNDMYRRLLSTEIAIMNKINHPNIVHLHELMESGNNYYLVLDYCDKGDFHQFLQARKARRLDEPEAVHFLRQIMHGFKELRRHKIIHRDFKLTNLLVSENSVKIADFGFAKRGHDVAKTIVGTYLTMAPELLVSSGESEYTSKSDLWSLGVVYYQILFGEPPYFGLTPNEIYHDIKRKSAGLALPHRVSPASQDLLARLLRMDPAERIDWCEFFAHELFAGEVSALPAELSPTLPAELSPAARRERPSKSPLPGPRSSTRDPPRAPRAPQVFNFKDIGHSTRSSNSTAPDCARSESTTANPPSPIRLRPRLPEEESEGRSPRTREVLQRYFHEKNKILFIVFAVRHLRKLTKQDEYRSLAQPLFTLCILLLRKAILLTEQCLASISAGQNLFGLAGFDQLANTPDQAAIVRAFDSDRPNFRNYLRYLLRTVRAEGLHAQMAGVLDRAEAAETPAQLEALLAPSVEAVKAALPGLGEEARRTLLVSLVSVQHSVDCDRYLPFAAGQDTLEWSAFLAVQELKPTPALLSSLAG
mgnify:CR=1 FL=1